MVTLSMLFFWVAGMLLLPAFPMVGAIFLFFAFRLTVRAARDEEHFVAGLALLAVIGVAVELGAYLTGRL